MWIEVVMKYATCRLVRWRKVQIENFDMLQEFVLVSIRHMLSSSERQAPLGVRSKLK